MSSETFINYSTESYFFEWYYVYDEDEILIEDEDWTLPYQQINKKIKCRFKVESDISPENSEIIIWNVYQWKEISCPDKINWFDQFEKDSLTGWINLTNNHVEHIEDLMITNWQDCIHQFVSMYYSLNDLQSEFFNNWKNEINKQIKEIHDKINKQRLKIKEPKKYISRKNRTFKHTAWAIMVKERDKNKCIQCNSTDNLHAHHIKQVKYFPEFQYDVNNGITLCGLCHTNYHKLNGYK